MHLSGCQHCLRDYTFRVSRLVLEKSVTIKVPKLQKYQPWSIHLSMHLGIRYDFPVACICSSFLSWVSHIQLIVITFSSFCIKECLVSIKKKFSCMQASLCTITQNIVVHFWHEPFWLHLWLQVENGLDIIRPHLCNTFYVVCTYQNCKLFFLSKIRNNFPECWRRECKDFLKRNLLLAS